jgi:uncharacterized damage-inducible protein DinB
MSADHYRLLYAYNRWAMQRILDRVAEVSEADYHAEAPGLSFGSLHATLVHIVVSETVWLARWQGRQLPEALQDSKQARLLGTTEIPDRETLLRMWEENNAAQDRYLAALTDADLEKPLRYTSQEGVANEQPLEPVLAHVVNHGTQFRSEAAVRLSQLGHSPGDLDLIVYLRQTR